jgi:hypothetical protein
MALVDGDWDPSGYHTLWLILMSYIMLGALISGLISPRATTYTTDIALILAQCLRGDQHILWKGMVLTLIV